MAYTKVIQSGTLVEQWTYERAPAARNPPKPRVKRLFAQPRRPDAIIASRNKFRRLVRANLDSSNPPALLTVTTARNTGISEGYALFTRLGSALHRAYPNQISYIGVPEFQKRGAVHFHILVFGLPEDLPCILSKSFYIDKTGRKKRRHVCPQKKQCERRTRTIARLWPHGYSDLVQTDGNARLSSYLAKYMSKALHDIRLIGKRGYSASRNVKRPVSLNTAFTISLAYELWGIVGDSEVARSKSYDTLFLGRCIYKQYIL